MRLGDVKRSPLLRDNPALGRNQKIKSRAGMEIQMGVVRCALSHTLGGVAGRDGAGEEEKDLGSLRLK